MTLKSLVAAVSLSLLAVTTPITQAAAPYDPAAVMFAQMMVGHHQQAVEISRLALKQGSNQAVKKIAKRIIQEQSPEISQLKSWIPAGAMSGMAMTTEGILSAGDLARLKAATGKKFDGLYLVDMTLHHEGAISMAMPLLASKNPEVAKLCKTIVTSQRAEVVELRRIMMTGK